MNFIAHVGAVFGLGACQQEAVPAQAAADAVLFKLHAAHVGGAQHQRARALGLADRIGTLEPGKWGDCVVLRSPAVAGSPEELTLLAGREDVIATFVGGRDVYRAEPVRS